MYVVECIDRVIYFLAYCYIRLTALLEYLYLAFANRVGFCIVTLFIGGGDGGARSHGLLHFYGMFAKINQDSVIKYSRLRYCNIAVTVFREAV